MQSGRLTAPDDSQPANRLYLNDGSGRFDELADSGADGWGYGMGVAVGDYDNDSDVDFYVTNLGEDMLLENDGGGRFATVTERAGLGHPGWGSSAAFVDYDRDGDLDLILVNYLRWSPGAELDCVNTLGRPDFCGPQSYAAPTPDVLYRNDGDGSFTNVSEELGFNTVVGNGLGVACADFDDNGWQDIFVANDQSLDRLWLNESARFVESGMIAGCAVDDDGKAKAGMGVAIGDVDDDGDTDLVVANMQDESDSYFRNEGGYFRDVTAAGGLSWITRNFTRFGMGWHDFDNDGALDFYEVNGKVEMRGTHFGADDQYAEPNLLFRGTSGVRFEEVEPRGGTASPLIATSRAAAFGDVDGDGGVDVLIGNCNGPAHLLRNAVAQRGHWIAFKVVLANGRDAIGARFTGRAGVRAIAQEVRAAYSYLASSDPTLHIGLGDVVEVLDVVVRWPDGSTERFGSFASGAVQLIQQGRGSS